MPIIKLKTEINADKTIVFDLSRSIDLHKISTEHTNETAIAGITERPTYFADEMIRGAFKGFKHEHHFEDFNGGTLMTDIFDYQSPFGIFGKLADNMFLKKYLIELLTERNRVVKEFAETDKWKEVIK